MGNIQILTKCCSQVIEEEYEVENRPIIEQIPILEEKINESFKTIIPPIGWEVRSEKWEMKKIELKLINIIIMTSHFLNYLLSIY